MEEIKLSTGKKCPRCGCDSLEVRGWAEYEKHYNCVAMCGMSFGLKRLKSGKIIIGFNKKNEEWLLKRFKFKEFQDDL